MATVYRADTIGSLLRPPYLKLAREQFEAGQENKLRLVGEVAASGGSRGMVAADPVKET